MDPLVHVDQIIGLVESARSVPMSANCVINRQDLLAALTRLRNDLPSELEGARSVLQQRDEVIAVGQQEAEKVLAEANLERNRLVSNHEVTLAAEAQAAATLHAAEEAATSARVQAERFCDTSLANLEQLLQRTLSMVETGQGRMKALKEIDGDFGSPFDEPF